MNLYQDVLFSTLDRLRGRKTVRRLRFLRESQHWPAERLRDWQLVRLNDLLARARAGSDYYRERLADVRLPLRSLAQLGDLPILERRTIQRHTDDIRTRNLPAARYVAAMTGGSTGEPTRYFWDVSGMDWNRGSVYRSAEWAGTALGERAIQMSSSRIDHRNAQRLRSRIAYWLQRYRDCPAVDTTEAGFARHYRTLTGFRPASIWGYGDAVDLFAGYVEERHPGGRYPYLKAVITSSVQLRAEHRARIERVFGAGKVFDHYGAREMYIGSECREHDGYHLHAEVVILEVVDDFGDPCPPGVPGRILVTDLSNHAFPFVRYEIGDFGILPEPGPPCGCGLSLPKLARVEGRIGDRLVLPDRIVAGVGIGPFPDCHAYQVRQEEIDRIRVLVEPNEHFDDGSRAFILRHMVDRVGDDVRVEIVTDEPIEVPVSGKRRYVISEISTAARAG